MDVSDIFYFSFLLGRGGSPRRREGGGGRFLIEARGWGVGAKYFFWGAEMSTKGRFDENGKNDELAVYPLKTRASLLRPPKTTKMTKMAGVTQAKAWLRKNGFVLP